MAIKIGISSLNEGSQVIELKSDENELLLDKGTLSGPLDIKLELFKTSNQLDLKAHLSGVLLLGCDRCLDEFQMKFTSDFELVFVQKSPREEEINEDYIRTYSPHMRTIDITNDIKEAVLLTVPMKKLPGEKPDGSCSWCGRTKDFWEGILTEKNEDDEF